MKTVFGIMSAATLAISASAAAQTPHSFNTTGNIGSTSSITRTATGETGPTALQMKVTGWQSKQSDDYIDIINSASVALFDGGLGVIGREDDNGANGYHQIDNKKNYTDFILLQFSRPVTLSSVILNSYALGGRTPDSDLAFWNASSLAPAAWDGSVNLTGLYTSAGLWTAANSTNSCILNCTRDLSATGTSTAWLISAAFKPYDDRDDGFKIAKITVSEAVRAVPEPSTWAMMLVGFGAAGFAMRRGQRTRKALRHSSAA